MHEENTKAVNIDLTEQQLQEARTPSPINVNLFADWNPPRGPYSVTRDGITMPDHALCVGGGEYEVTTRSLCDKEDIKATVIPKESMTVLQLARRAQLANSIGHVTRRACEECLHLYQHGLSPFERKYLISTDPKLGAIIGMSSLNAPANPHLTDEYKQRLGAFRTGAASLATKAGK